MSPFALVVVSDLHAGRSSEFSDLRTTSTTDANAGFVGQSLNRETLVQAIKEDIDGVEPERVILVCAGDLTNDCHSNELALAAKFLTNVAEELRIPKKNRVLVPGNHDVDWHLTRLSDEADSWYEHHRQSKFEQILKETARTFTFPVRGIPKDVCCLKGDVQLILLDSPHLDRHQPIGDAPHHGALGEEQRRALQRILAEPNDSAVRVLILHHHMEQIALNDFSILQDAGELKDICFRYGIDFIIHGHQHRPRFKTLSSGLRSIPLLCAGSTTADYAKLPREEQNSFHVVRFEGKIGNIARGQITTRILKRVIGWVRPNSLHHNIADKHVFGASVSQQVLHEWVLDILNECEIYQLVPIQSYLSRKEGGLHVCAHEFAQMIKQKIETRKLSFALANEGLLSVQVQKV